MQLKRCNNTKFTSLLVKMEGKCVYHKVETKNRNSYSLKSLWEVQGSKVKYTEALKIQRVPEEQIPFYLKWVTWFISQGLPLYSTPKDIPLLSCIMKSVKLFLSFNRYQIGNEGKAIMPLQHF